MTAPPRASLQRAAPADAARGRSDSGGPRSDRPTSVTPGDLVRVRDATWRVSGVRVFPHVRLLRLIGADALNRWQPCTLIEPFDRPHPAILHDAPRIVSRRRWMRTLAALIASAPEPHRPATAAGADVTLMAYQLGPLLAVLHGRASRLLLADAVGLGKTIQAALLIRELRARGCADRVLVLVPPGLRDQWQQELLSRAGLRSMLMDADTLSARAREVPPDVNPWSLPGLLVASLDFIKQPHVLRGANVIPWDILIVDEAHGLGDGTDRLAAVRTLARRSRYVVLLTATPHHGSDDGFDALCRIGQLDDPSPPSASATNSRVRDDEPRRIETSRMSGAAEHDSMGTPAKGTASRSPQAAREHLSRPSDPIVIFRRTRAALGLAVQRRVHVLRVARTREERWLDTLLERYARRIERDRLAGDAASLALSVLIKRASSSAWSLERSLRRRLALLDAAQLVPTVTQPTLPFDRDPTGPRHTDGSEDDDPADREPLQALGAPGLRNARVERAWLRLLIAAAHNASRGESKTRALARWLRRTREPALIYTEYRDTLTHLASLLAVDTHREHSGDRHACERMPIDTERRSAPTHLAGPLAVDPRRERHGDRRGHGRPLSAIPAMPANHSIRSGSHRRQSARHAGLGTGAHPHAPPTLHETQSSSLVILHGGLSAEARRAALGRFAAGDARVLLTTDAAGEGLNLQQRCRLVINVELPWNPNRLEQRVGRVDRLGQTRTVHAVHFVAAGTAEEGMLGRLNGRLDRIAAVLGDAPDVLSDAAASGPIVREDARPARDIDDGPRAPFDTPIGPTAADAPAFVLVRDDEQDDARTVTADLERIRALEARASLRRWRDDRTADADRRDPREHSDARAAAGRRLPSRPRMRTPRRIDGPNADPLLALDRRAPLVAVARRGDRLGAAIGLDAEGLLCIWRVRSAASDGGRSVPPTLVAMHVACRVPRALTRRAIASLVASNIDRVRSQIDVSIAREYAAAERRADDTTRAWRERLAWRDAAIGEDLRAQATGLAQPLLFQDIAAEQARAHARLVRAKSASRPGSIPASASGRDRAAAFDTRSIDAAGLERRLTLVLVVRGHDRRAASAR